MTPTKQTEAEASVRTKAGRLLMSQFSKQATYDEFRFAYAEAVKGGEE